MKLKLLIAIVLYSFLPSYKPFSTEMSGISSAGFFHNDLVHLGLRPLFSFIFSFLSFFLFALSRGEKGRPKT